MTTRLCGSTILTGRPCRTHGKGRVCGHPGCETIVSQYNPSDYCGVHDRLHAVRFDIDSLLFTTKRCPVCERHLPANSNHWHRDAREEDGFKNVCSRCLSRAVA